MSIADKLPAAPRANPRSLARIGAVQALYQMDLAGTDLNDVIDEFARLRFGKAGAASADEASNLEGADPTFFAEVLRGVVARQRDIDPMVDRQLAAGWSLARVDSILRAILRASVYELLERPDVPARVVINEYVDIAHAFFDDDQPKVVNGVLDNIARRERPAEFRPREAPAADG